MSKREILIGKIGDLVIGNLNGFTDYEIEYDEDGLHKAFICGSTTYEFGNGRCDVEYSVLWSSNSTYVECKLYGCEGIHEKRFKKLDCLEEAVQEYVDGKIDTDSILSDIEDRYREWSYDEWEEHGFRDAQDYYSWRYK